MRHCRAPARPDVEIPSPPTYWAMRHTPRAGVAGHCHCSAPAIKSLIGLKAEHRSSQAPRVRNFDNSMRQASTPVASAPAAASIDRVDKGHLRSAAGSTQTKAAPLFFISDDIVNRHLRRGLAVVGTAKDRRRWLTGRATARWALSIIDSGLRRIIPIAHQVSCGEPPPMANQVIRLLR